MDFTYRPIVNPSRNPLRSIVNNNTSLENNDPSTNSVADGSLPVDQTEYLSRRPIDSFERDESRRNYQRNALLMNGPTALRRSRVNRGMRAAILPEDLFKRINNNVYYPSSDNFATIQV